MLGQHLASPGVRGDRVEVARDYDAALPPSPVPIGDGIIGLIRSNSRRLSSIRLVVVVVQGGTISVQHIRANE